MELRLLLPRGQWAALESAADSRGVTMGELLRQLISAPLLEAGGSGKPDAMTGVGTWSERVEIPGSPEEGEKSDRVEGSLSPGCGQGKSGHENRARAQMQDALLALLAHELRNPLGAICHALQVLRRCGDAATRETLQRLLESQTRQMSELIEEVLDFARFNHGKGQLRTHRVELGQVVSMAIETARPGIDQRGHLLEVALPPGPVILEADPARLVQIMTNLLDNAARYTEPGGRIWLTAEDEGDNIVLRVKDSGVGISRQALPHIFDLFWQSSRGAGHSGEGLGIGLALVRRLAEMHGGSVNAASDGPGLGSMFAVVLPRGALARDQETCASDPHLTVGE